MRELAVVVPTRGRPENVRKVISAWDFTNAWDSADLVLAVDADDPEIRGYRDLFEEHRHPDTDEPLFSIVVQDVWRPMVHKLDRVAVALAESRTYFAVAFAGDDHLPQTIGWAARYLTVLHELGTGMVYGDDGYQGSKLSTEWAVTADAVRTLGRMVPAPVEHMYCDNSMMDLFGGAGALRHLPEVRIEHMHPIAGKAQTDAQYRRVNHRDQFRKDRLAYEGWKRSGLSADEATIRALRPGAAEFRPLVRVERPTSPVGRINRPGPMRSGPTQKRIREMGMSRFPFSQELKTVRGATPDEIGMALADFAAMVPADREIVELGVFQGRTALIMAWGAAQGGGAHVTGVDPWELEGNVYDPPFTDEGSGAWARYWVRDLGYAERVTLIQGFSQDVGAEWSGPSVGLLYVDGDHTKEGARRDIETWAPHLAPGARIAVDDYIHVDWPGVAEAVDELVAEGFLEPVEIYHDRLAVTRLAEPRMERTGAVKAITSEGVSPSPYPAAPGQVAAEPETFQVGAATVTELSGPERAELEAEWERVDPEGVAALRESAAALEVDSKVSTTEENRTMVRAGELEGVAAGTEVEELTIPQMKTLAKGRGIVLGVRKDKRAEIVQAIADGR